MRTRKKLSANLTDVYKRQRIDRPIVLYNIDGYYDKMKALLEYTAEEKFMDFSVLDLVVFLDEPAAVLDYLENYKK